MSLSINRHTWYLSQTPQAVPVEEEFCQAGKYQIERDLFSSRLRNCLFWWEIVHFDRNILNWEKLSQNDNYASKQRFDQVSSSKTISGQFCLKSSQCTCPSFALNRHWESLFETRGVWGILWSASSSIASLHFYVGHHNPELHISKLHNSNLLFELIFLPPNFFFKSTYGQRCLTARLTAFLCRES